MADPSDDLPDNESRATGDFRPVSRPICPFVFVCRYKVNRDLCPQNYQKQTQSYEDRNNFGILETLLISVV